MKTRSVVVGGGVCVALAITAGVALAQNGPQTGILDGVQQGYQTASHAWAGRLVPVAQRAFALLAGIEVVLSALVYGLRRDAMDDLAAKFVLKFAILSVVVAAITYSGTWVRTIVNGFAAAGERATGTTGTVDPSEVIDLGVQVAGSMLAIFDGWGIVRHPVFALYSAVCADLVLLAYVFIAAQLLLVLVESYVVLGSGVLFVAMAGFRGTAGYADGFVNLVVHTGIKIFLLYLVVGVGIEVSKSWVPLLTPDLNFGAGSPIWQVFAGVIVFAIMTYRIPNTMASRITSHGSFSVAHALRAL